MKVINFFYTGVIRNIITDKPVRTTITGKSVKDALRNIRIRHERPIDKLRLYKEVSLRKSS